MLILKTIRFELNWQAKIVFGNWWLESQLCRHIIDHTSTAHPVETGLVEVTVRRWRRSVDVERSIGGGRLTLPRHLANVFEITICLVYQRQPGDLAVVAVVVVMVTTINILITSDELGYREWRPATTRHWWRHSDVTSGYFVCIRNKNKIVCGENQPEASISRYINCYLSVSRKFIWR